MSKTCVVMGNGASLLDMPQELLSEYDSFGMNFSRFQPTHYVCTDSLILLSMAGQIYDRAANAKIAYLNSFHGKETEEVKRLYALPNVKLIYKDKGEFSEELFMTGYNASYVALKMAFYEGYERVLLWGVDMDLTWHHYREDYPVYAQQTKMRVAVMKIHLDYANDVFKKHGRQILNFSKPSALEFERGEKA